MTRFAKHVSVIWDLTACADWVPILPACHHHLYPSPVPPGPPMIEAPFGFSVEAPAIIANPPGSLLGDHKLTSTVYHNHVWFALDGHDVGHCLGHLCVPPVGPGPCTLMSFNILLSSRKAKFATGEVKANGKPVACCTMIEPDAPAAVTPLLVCGAMPAPVAGCGTAVAFNSLLVGMHVADLIAGWVDVLCTMAVSAAMNAGPVEAGSLSEGLGFSPVPDVGSWAGNFIRLVAQSRGYYGDATFEYKPVSGPFGEAGRSITVDGVSGDVTSEEAGELRAGGLGGVRHSEREIRRHDGTVDRETSNGATWWGGGESTTTERSTNGGEWQEQDGTSSSSSLPWSEWTDVPFL